MKRPGKIEIFKDRSGEWRFRVKSGNGQIVAQSEGYTRKASCYKGVEALARIAKVGIKPVEV